MNLGNNISAFRKKCNLTQAELAEKLSVSYQAVSQWENSNTYPDITILPTLAKIFNVSLDELFGLEKTKEKTIEFSENFDKDTLYCVVAKGNKVIKANTIKEVLANNSSIKFVCEGEVLNVTSHLNVVCDNVTGDVNANGSVTCDNVTGDVNAKGSVTCDHIYGSCEAGGSITCDNIDGNVSAGGSVSCDHVEGSVSAKGSINIRK